MVESEKLSRRLLANGYCSLASFFKVSQYNEIEFLEAQHLLSLTVAVSLRQFPQQRWADNLRMTPNTAKVEQYFTNRNHVSAVWDRLEPRVEELSKGLLTLASVNIENRAGE
jgi:hypothetical protein